jgi:ASC-1-like (ASCH) protein
MIHEMSLREAPYRAVASGKKVIEMRLYDPKRQLIRVGDSIRFTLVGSTESVTAEVVGLHPFPSFAELYAAMIPMVGEVGLGYAEGEDARPEDMLDYYSSDAVARYGVIGIEIMVRK